MHKEEEKEYSNFINCVAAKRDKLPTSVTTNRAE